LRTAIRLALSGMLVLAVSVLAAVLAVMRFVFGSGAASVTATLQASLVLTLWYALPLLRRVIGDRPR
jgi:hypothetical protein